MLDYNQICLGDKFGQFSIMRVPSTVETDFQLDLGNDQYWKNGGILTGAKIKFEQSARFYQINLISQLFLVNQVQDRRSFILALDIEGGIRLYHPVQSNQDRALLAKIEDQMRLEENYQSVTGRDQLLFRSYLGSVHGVIDLDLCQELLKSPLEKQERILNKVS